jgi:hypothetical protein
MYAAFPAIPPAYFIAHRYDATRVVFSLERTFRHDPDLRQRSLAHNPTRLPDPAARLGGMTLWSMDEEFWKQHAGELTGPAPGDRWIVKAGGLTEFHCTIERLAMAEISCGTAIVAIGQVDPAEQTAFKLVSERHYLVVSEASATSASPPQAGPALLKELPALAAEEKEKLEASLQEQFQRELPRVRRAAGASYALMARLGRMNSWQERDERLARGEGKLLYDLRALRLTPDGELRYYVRARWTLDGETAFLMSAWVRPDHNMFVESVYRRPSEWMRMNEFQSERLGLNDLGFILNVFDYDGDGWGEILIAQRRPDGFDMHLLEYSERRGLVRTGIGYRYGC